LIPLKTFALERLGMNLLALIRLRDEYPLPALPCQITDDRRNI
jgi:hypothetical protein